MGDIDLCDPKPMQLALFVSRVAEKAETDHRQGVKRRPTGRELCGDFSEGWRGFHPRLATTVYNKTRRSLEAAERERREAGLE